MPALTGYSRALRCGSICRTATEAKDVVGAIHAKAMPVILTTPEEIETWMTAPAEEALKLQRPLRDGSLAIVARGERKDEAIIPA